MLRAALLVLLMTSAIPAPCAESDSGGWLMPAGVRAIATPDDCSIIVISDPTGGTGTGLQWLGVSGAIACNADNSIIVWTGGYAPPLPPTAPPAPPVAPTPATSSPTAAPTPGFLWPEGVEHAVPFDLDNSIIVK